MINCSEEIKQKDNLNNDKEEIDKLVLRAKQNDKDAQEDLVKKYKKLIYSRINIFKNIPKNEKENLYSECLVALLLKAVQSYKADSKASFTTFATICIDNTIKTYYSKLKKSNKKKLLYLSDEIIDVIPDNNDDMVVKYFAKVRCKELWGIIKSVLNDEQVSIVEMKSSGMSNKEIAEKLGGGAKNISNKWEYIQRKLKKLFKENI